MSPLYKSVCGPGQAFRHIILKNSGKNTTSPSTSQDEDRTWQSSSIASQNSQNYSRKKTKTVQNKATTEIQSVAGPSRSSASPITSQNTSTESNNPLGIANKSRNMCLADSLALIKGRDEVNMAFNRDTCTVDEAWTILLKHLGWNDRYTAVQLKKRFTNMVDAWKKDCLNPDGTIKENFVKENGRVGTQWYPAMTEFQKKNPAFNPAIVFDSSEDFARENPFLTQKRDNQNSDESDENGWEDLPTSVLKSKKGRSNPLAKRNAKAKESRPQRKTNLTLLQDGLELLKTFIDNDKDYKNNLLTEFRKHNNIMSAVAKSNAVSIEFSQSVPLETQNEPGLPGENNYDCSLSAGETDEELNRQVVDNEHDEEEPDWSNSWGQSVRAPHPSKDNNNKSVGGDEFQNPMDVDLNDEEHNYCQHGNEVVANDYGKKDHRPRSRRLPLIADVYSDE